MPTALRFGLNLVMFKQLTSMWAALSASVVDPEHIVLVGNLKPADKEKLRRGCDEETNSDDDDSDSDSDDEDSDGETVPVTKQWVRKVMAEEDPVTATVQSVPFRTALEGAVNFFTPLMQLQRLGDMDKATAAYRHVVPAVERMEDKFKAAIEKGEVPHATEARDGVMKDEADLKHAFFIVAATCVPSSHLFLHGTLLFKSIFPSFLPFRPSSIPLPSLPSLHFLPLLKAQPPGRARREGPIASTH